MITKRANLFHVCIGCGVKNAPLEYEGHAYCDLCYKRARLMQWGKQYNYPDILCPRRASDAMDYAIAAGQDMRKIGVSIGDERMIDTALAAVGLVGISDDIDLLSCGGVQTQAPVIYPGVID